MFFYICNGIPTNVSVIYFPFNNLPLLDSSAAETMVHGVSMDNMSKEVNTKAEQVNTSV